MAASYSAQDLKQLLEQWWAQAPQAMVEGESGPELSAADQQAMPIPAAASSASQDQEQDPAGGESQRQLQIAEVMMLQLDVDDVAEAVLQQFDAAEPESPVSDPVQSRLAQQRREGLLAAWARVEKQRWTRRRQQETSLEDSCGSWIALWKKNYSISDPDSLATAYLLAVLAWQGRDGLQQLTDAVVAVPPTNAQAVSLLFAPLVFRDDLPAEVLYPKLLDAVGELGLATAVLDLGNFLYRQRDVRPHPASERVSSLAQLLSQVTQRLLQVEEDPVGAGLTAERLSEVINDSVGLVAALCDTLSLCGDSSVVGKIYPCLEVKHRRVQLESATALAALGEETGKQRLVELAAEPVVRRRVLAYCQALGLLDKVEHKYKTDAAEAEAEMALWLSHPAHMGFAPFDVSVVDEREQYWPGYTEPVNCFLLRYSYPFEDQVYQNVGLVGPITHSFSVSLSLLPPEDVYAVFAGWHVEHPEIYAIAFADAGPLQRGTIAGLERRLQQESIEVDEACLLGHCLGRWALIVRGQRADRGGWAIADNEDCVWLPDDAGFQDFDASLAWYLHLGRKLLQEFNS